LADNDFRDKKSVYEFFQTRSDRYVWIDHSIHEIEFTGKIVQQEFTALVYDKNLQLLSTTELEKISGKEYQHGIVLDGRLILFAADKKTFYKYELTEDWKQVKTEEELFSTLKPKKEYDVTTLGVSADSSYLFIVMAHKNHNGSSVEGVIMNREFKVVTKVNVMNMLPDVYVSGINYKLSNEGILNIIFQSKGKRYKDDDPVKFYIVQVGTKKKDNAAKLLELGEGYIGNICWQAVGTNLSFVGFIGDKKVNYFAKYLTGNYDGKTSKLVDVKIQDSVMAPANDTSNWGGVPKRAILRKVYEFPDHSRYLFFEHNQVTTTITNQKYGWESYYYFSSNAYVAKVDGAGEMVWMRKIEKNQNSPIEESFMGSITSVDKAGNLYVVYHDKKLAGDSNNVVVLNDHNLRKKNYCISVMRFEPDGKMTHQYVERPADTDFFLTTKHVAEGEPGRLLIPFMDLKMGGRSRIKPGLLSVD
jgi:hypothetical protein